MPVEAIKNLEEFKEIIKGGKPVVIDFWATWCRPCKAISPIFEKLAVLVDDDSEVDVRFYKVDIDEVESVAKECGIKNVPTFIYFKGDKVDEVKGARVDDLVKLASQAAGKPLTLPKTQ